MNKIALIIQREFLSRVRKKSFIIMTILGPLLFAAMAIVPTLLTLMDSSNRYNIAVFDSTNSYQECFVNSDKITFSYLDENDKISPSALLTSSKEAKYDGYLDISEDLIENPSAIKLYSQNPITLESQHEINRMVEAYLRTKILNQNQSPEFQSVIAKLEKAKISITNITVTQDGEETKNAAEMAMGISMLLAFLSYGLIIGYGSQVMKGVTEEKTNRIVEIIISSVKPFQLMMGKIIGIAMVALTQFLIWIALTLAIITFVQTVVLPKETKQRMEQQMATQNGQSTIGAASVQAPTQQSMTESITNQLMGIELKYLLFMFAFYFIGGYLLYAAMFAAVGSAIDPDTDSQQFVMPVMMPLIIALTIAMSTSRDPHGTLAFWGSIIPFTSPIIMMARLPYSVPLWQLLLSMGSLIITFVGMTIFAAKIYRVGILMYGKKVSYKELWKWLKYK